MSDLKRRLPENVMGRFYVDAQCIDCEVCRDIARENFTRSPAKKYCYVKKQPVNSAEEGLCREAMDACPVEAIGDDGR